MSQDSLLHLRTKDDLRAIEQSPLMLVWFLAASPAICQLEATVSFMVRLVQMDFLPPAKNLFTSESNVYNRDYILKCIQFKWAAKLFYFTLKSLLCPHTHLQVFLFLISEVILENLLSVLWAAFFISSPLCFLVQVQGNLLSWRMWCDANIVFYIYVLTVSVYKYTKINTVKEEGHRLICLDAQRWLVNGQKEQREMANAS